MNNIATEKQYGYKTQCNILWNHIFVFLFFFVLQHLLEARTLNVKRGEIKFHLPVLTWPNCVPLSEPLFYISITICGCLSYELR